MLQYAGMACQSAQHGGITEEYYAKNTKNLLSLYTEFTILSHILYVERAPVLL